MKEIPKVILSSGKDQSIRRFHPWVFSGAIKKITDVVEDGDVVEVYDNKDNFLGTGHYQMGSIAVRVFSFEKINPDKNFWKEKLIKAYNCRNELGLIDNTETNVYRLVFAEGDGFPGLILDFYNGTIVMQCHSIGMHKAKNEIAESLKEIYGEKLKCIYDKSSGTLPKQAKYKAVDGYLFRKSDIPVVTEGIVLQHAETNEVNENGNKFFIDWEGGQKTGFFIDQRENRKLLAQFCKGKNVLNTFCYTGGFSVYAAKAGASLVHSVDSSGKAIELTEKNILLNNISNHQSFTEDVFDFFERKQNQYDSIILDPPAFAKHRDAKHRAVMGYKRLNGEALKQINPNGILFTFSCSQVVDKNLFESTIMSAAIIAKRNVRILHHLSQPPDHAANIFHPEGEYLKGLVLFVE